jgi:hypothetical protein
MRLSAVSTSCSDTAPAVPADAPTGELTLAGAAADIFAVPFVPLAQLALAPLLFVSFLPMPNTVRIRPYPALACSTAHY